MRKSRKAVSFPESVAAVEPLESRLLLSVSVKEAAGLGGSISGIVYNDLNGNGDSTGESALAGRQVYLDLQGIDTLVGGDPVSTTDGAGNYAFTGLAAGNYLVRLVPLSGHVTTQPVWGGKFFVQLGAGQSVAGDNFLDAPVAAAPHLQLINGQLLIANLGGAVGTIARFNADSSVDTTFGTLGAYTIPGNGGAAQSMTTLPDGTISVIFPSLTATLTSGGALISTAPTSPGGGPVVVAAPTGLVATSPSPTLVHLSFTDNSTNEQSFVIERSGSAGGPWAFVGAITGSTSTGPRTFDDSSVVAGTTYFYRVYGANGTTLSAIAGPVSVTTSGGGTIVLSGATITGTLFNDINGNGARDVGETILAGSQLYLDLQGIDALATGDPIATTDATGLYTFTGLTSGNYLVRPVPVNGHVITSPVWGGKYFVQLNTNQTISGDDFGIEAPAVIFAIGSQSLVAGTSGGLATLTRFNADQSADVSFGYLGGVTLPAIVTGVPTAASGQPGGNVVVTYPTQIVTLGPTGAVVSIVANNGGIDPVTLSAPTGLSAVASSPTAVNLTFTDNSTNEQGFTIERATNQSGPWTAVVHMAGSPTTGQASAADTAASANTTYYYRVYAVSGATQSAISGPVSVTTPGVIVVPPTSAAIGGSVYNDANGNGLRDGGETGVPLHGVYLDLQGLGTFQAGDPTATTDANGSYTFTGLQPGNYIVRLLPRAGDQLTYPYPQYGGLYFLALGANQAVKGKDFGLVPSPTYPTGQIAPGANVNASRLAGSESGAQIAINPGDPNNIVIVSQSGDNNGDLLPFSTSVDGGKTWSTRLVGAEDGLSTGTPRPDAKVAFDAFGTLYLTYMVAASRTEIRLVVLRSIDGGATFTSLGAAVSGGFNPDSPSIATGPSAIVPGAQAVWISFTDYNSRRVMIVGGTSTGTGQFSGWSAPATVSQSFGTFSCVAVGPVGELAVSWQSTDGGTIVPNNLNINYDYTGGRAPFSADTLMAITRVGGIDPIPAQPDRTIDAEARIAFDRRGGEANRRLYLVYTDISSGSGSNTDIYLKYSETLGASWSSPLKVNDDATQNSQFNPAIAVDQSTGNVGLSWLDARKSADNTGVELFTTVSLDHGVSVQPNVQVAAGLSFQSGANPNSNDLDFGDTGGLAFQGGKLIPVWSDNTNSTGDNPGGTGRSLDVYANVIAMS